MAETGASSPRAENESARKNAVSSDELERLGGGDDPKEALAIIAQDGNAHQSEEESHVFSQPMRTPIEGAADGNGLERTGGNGQEKAQTSRRKRLGRKGESVGQKPGSTIRKRGRSARMISIGKDQRTSRSVSDCNPFLPGNQYSTTLRRRAVRKLEDCNINIEAREEFGDVSLGMKLIVVGGRVIVQSLNGLSDGLASPAQLVGTICRGDVLLAIGSLSLVNLPVDQLMDGLRPLSTPGPRGEYERVLYLRFEAGAGLALLKVHEEGQAVSQARQDPADTMFSLFPMVDQLSGAPLFDNHVVDAQNDDKTEEKEYAGSEAQSRQGNGETELLSTPLRARGGISIQDLDVLISSTLAQERRFDQTRYRSQYFDWREDLSCLLRRSVNMVREGEDTTTALTQTQRLALGGRILEMTKALERSMEEIDKGRDLRSFKTWSTNFSFRSGVSARRRFVIDTASARSKRCLDSSCDNSSVNSEDSEGSLNGVDADTLLLGLAARDEIWRKQVLDVLENEISETASFEQNMDTEEDVTTTYRHGVSNMNEALTKQLGNFLFGEMTKIVTNRKGSVALPPSEITRVLFDLTTNLATKKPVEVTLFGTSNTLSYNVSSSCSATIRTDGKSKAAVRTDMLLANRFVLDEALPKWLKTFRPIPLNQRRALWPKLSRSQDTATSTFTGQLSENTARSAEADDLTVDSRGSHSQSSTPSKKKGIRELVEAQQIDSETRSETCFLVTYFYAHAIIDGGANGIISGEEEKVFVAQYGAYLQLHSCLTYAAAAKDESAITHLLEAARFDPCHLDGVKEIKKSNPLVFYESSKLSALLECLHDIRFDKNRDRRNLVRDLCVSAFPDIFPWQVRQACLDCSTFSEDSRIPNSDECLDAFYYSYLSHLLNPLDGNDAARHDAALVKEYCEWSVGLQPRLSKRPERIENFLSIASRSSIQHKRYTRNLMSLLEFAIVIGKDDLVLDLVDEILHNSELLFDKESLHVVLMHLRTLGHDSLAQISSKAKEFRIFGRVLRLLETMACSDSVTCRTTIALADELYSLFQEWKMRSGSNGADPRMYLLVDFVIDESSCPDAVVGALVLWSSSNDCGELLFPRLRALLCRGLHHAALKGELSGTLLRLRHARSTFTEHVLSDEKGSKSTGGIWESMATGILAIDK